MSTYSVETKNGTVMLSYNEGDTDARLCIRTENEHGYYDLAESMITKDEARDLQDMLRFTHETTEAPANLGAVSLQVTNPMREATLTLTEHCEELGTLTATATLGVLDSVDVSVLLQGFIGHEIVAKVQAILRG